MSLYLFIGFLAGASIMYFFMKARFMENYISGEKHESICRDLNQKVHSANENIKVLTETIFDNKAQISVLKEKLDSKEKDVSSLESKFKILATTIIEDNSNRLMEQNKTNLNNILAPLKKDIEGFEKKVNEVYENEARERYSLTKEVQRMFELNQSISKEANNLTQALKGHSKIQGAWGEMILENILEKSGLRKGQEYLTQHTLTSLDENLKYRPDVIIKFPDNRHVIVDSKVSLLSYEKYCSSDDFDLRQKELQRHVASIKSHIDSLNSKNYFQHMEDVDSTLELTMMFVPIEPAYLLAIQHDQDLWQYSFDRKVLLVSPTTLMAALKLFSDLWKREQQSKNAIKIAVEAGQLYDKFVGFTEDLHDIGKRLKQADDSYLKALNKLSNGKGNLIRRVEVLKKMGAAASKNLNHNLLQEINEQEILE